ncbi:phosphoribosyltransferase family protein [Oerskovia jenensis]|uniref:Adenine/guanine phosphoribosyltransferase-like PRPP-binding protein n=1 Tax=Oerskovia jenensis TaxID=162169 RepID=A0ABS2LG29_9CELL|nr:phosphoribosyltransferase family protein [Oerskovia jenensis]MBM7479073.1 adenine/guanine phosphoribosyltransferase-like PRPP-binding protein [Oerskovia jenensis]
MSGRFALSSLTCTDGGDLVLSGQDVTVDDYGAFKHGDGALAARFADRLSDRFVRAVLPHDVDVLVTSSGFDVVPPAAYSLVAPFLAGLRRAGHVGQVRHVKVGRTRVSDGDYAGMSLEERRTSLTGHDLVLDPAVDARGAHVVALDDVVVTGVHERAMESALRRAGAAHVDHVYLVDAHAVGGVPMIEARLNTAGVPSVRSLVEVMHRPGFVPNARVARRVLSLGDADLAELVATAPPWVLRWVEEAAAADKLGALARYRSGAGMLHDLLRGVPLSA